MRVPLLGINKPKKERNRKGRKIKKTNNNQPSSSRSSSSVKSSSRENKKIKSESVNTNYIRDKHRVTDVVIIKYHDEYYFNTRCSRLSVGEKSEPLKSFKRGLPHCVKVEGEADDYLRNATNYLRQFKDVFHSCGTKPAGLLFSFEAVTGENEYEIKKEFSDGGQFVGNVKQGTVDVSKFRAIIDLDFHEIIWRDENEISRSLNSQPALKSVSEPQTDLEQVISVNSDVISESGESASSETIFERVEIITEEDDEDEMEEEIDFEEEFEMDLMEEQAENNLILDGQHNFITKLFNIETEENRNTSRPEFDPKYFPKSHQIFKTIEESIKTFVVSPTELTASALTTCLNYLHDQSMDIYQCKDFQLFEASSLQIYIIHCLKLVRSECFARNYHPTRVEHEKFKRIALANMKAATFCAKLMATSSLNYFFTDQQSSSSNSSNSSNDVISQAIPSSTTDAHVNMEQLLGKWLKLSEN